MGERCYGSETNFLLKEVAMANPRWTRDETIIALQFYFDHAPSIPPKNSHQIYELSQLLNNLQTKLGGAIPENSGTQTGYI